MFLFKKSWQFFTYKQKRYAIFIFALMFFAMILESLSVGIILPLTSILLKGNMDISFLPNFFESQLPTGKKLIYLGLLITILVFLIKNLLLVFNLWQQTKFLRNMQFEITNKLFKYYLKSEYLFFLQNNSAHLYRNLTDIIGAFVSYTKAYMIFFTEIIVFMGIAFILFYIDFLGTTLI